MTKQEFQMILPCYFGQKVINLNGEIGTIDDIALNPHTKEIEVLSYGLSGFRKIGSFKLILRRMEDMTDDENEHLDITIEGCITIQGFNYLRSIGIDCDGLIESGYAVREKDLKK